MAYRDRYTLEPLHVRANLRTPVIADKWLPLDGVLLYQAHRDKMGPQVMTVPGNYTCNGVSTLPLAIEHPGQHTWYYHCSWAQWSHDVEGCDYWNKRFDQQFVYLVDFGKRRGKVIIEKGRYKAYHMPVFYRAALWVEWWCVGDRTEIEYLLSTVTHLGKKSSQGYGRVINWVVESVKEDHSIYKDNCLMRGIPQGDVLQAVQERDIVFPFSIGHYGIRPSYWKASNQMALALPA